MTIDTTVDERRRRRAFVAANPLEDTIAAWTAAVRKHRSSPSLIGDQDALLEAGRLELVLISLEDAGVPGAAEFIATMVDLDEAIRFEIHGPYNPKGHPTP